MGCLCVYHSEFFSGGTIDKNLKQKKNKQLHSKALKEKRGSVVTFHCRGAEPPLGRYLSFTMARLSESVTPELAASVRLQEMGTEKL